MPFASEKQRKYLYSQKPEVAAKFAAHTPKKKLSGAAHRSKMVKRATEGLKKVFY